MEPGPSLLTPKKLDIQNKHTLVDLSQAQLLSPHRQQTSARKEGTKRTDDQSYSRKDLRVKRQIRGADQQAVGVGAGGHRATTEGGSQLGSPSFQSPGIPFLTANLTDLLLASAAVLFRQRKHIQHSF